MQDATRALILVFGLILTDSETQGQECTSTDRVDRSNAQLFRHGPLQVGEEQTHLIANPAILVAAEQAVLAWSTEIYYPDASYIAPHFSSFLLPAGAHLVVRSPNGNRSWTYVGRGKEGIPIGEGFWGIHIPGDTALLELHTTAAVPANAIRLDRFAHGFTGPRYPSLDASGVEAICGSDNSKWARCYESSEPTVYERSLAVARLLIMGTSGCTGWLVGSAGHLMTNEHCISSSYAARNTDYEFLAEGACDEDCATAGGCPGTVVATTATLVEKDSARDFTLVKLPINPTGKFGFLRMRKTGAVVDEQIYIPGHPATWGKRIALESTHSSDASGFCEVRRLDEAPCNGGPDNVGYFCDTRDGSSGSPVLAYSDHAVVALHHCGTCPNRGVPIQDIISDLDSNLPPDSITGLVPAGLDVDISVSGTSDGNGVFETGESCVVAPRWHNVATDAVAFGGVGSDFTGPSGSSYAITDSIANYGSVIGNMVGSCSDTGDCYELSIDSTTRPTQHWDTAFEESLTSGQTKNWILHVGGSFADVARSNVFYPFVETIYHYGITTGCSSTHYCPNATITRQQVAVFILRSVEGKDYTPPPCQEGAEMFADVPAFSPYCSWIEEMARRQIQSGCGSGNFCPHQATTRAQAAPMFLKSIEGPVYVPPPCVAGDEMFVDVPASNVLCRWIEELAHRDITSGCGSGKFCPSTEIRRNQMATFFTKTYGLRLYGP